MRKRKLTTPIPRGRSIFAPALGPVIAQTTSANIPSTSRIANVKA